MKRKTLFLLTFALIVPLAVRAQPATATPQQPANPVNSIEDDPQFKRLSPEKQELVRKAMQNIDNAVAAEQKAAATPATPKPQAATQTGCDASPVKKPRFHLPKSVQDAINKQAKQVGSKTGVDVDANAPAKAVKDAQAKLPPCPPAATPVKK